MVTTSEHLDALPVGSVIRSRGGSTWVKEQEDILGAEYIGWVQAGVEGSRSAEWLADRDYLPAIVLHTPRD